MILNWIRSWFKTIPTVGAVEVPKKHFDENLLSSAILDKLWPIPSRGDSYPVSEQVLLQDEAWIARNRAWVTENVHDAQIIAGYERWFQYVQRGIDKNREENRTHARANAHREWNRKSDIQRKSINAIADLIPGPPK